MPLNLTHKIIEEHLIEGSLEQGAEIGLRIDQTLTQDATGTLVMLELEAMQLDRVQTDLSAQYVDHNLIQEDNKNPDDHLFLESACRRFGLWFSRPGGGVSHPLHQQYFGKPGATLLGSDSHTCAAGALGMLAMGAGGLEVATAMAGEPFYVKLPQVWGIRLEGQLPNWVSAKDVILEMLRRHGVSGGVGRVLEYSGPGLEHLSAMDRHVIANMGAELGATGTVFPADEQVYQFLAACGREGDYRELLPDDDCEYDAHEMIDLSSLEPLIALPSSPGNVKRVHEIAGQEIYQAYIGSSANPGFRDFAVAAEIVKGRRAHAGVSLDINPSSRSVLLSLMGAGHITSLIEAGARLHQAGCNGCIGMGQAPATGRISLRTVPRNFPGRSGTPDDQVFLVSPETAAASALRGKITDPRELDMPYPQVREPKKYATTSGDSQQLIVPPLPLEAAQQVNLIKGPNVGTFPEIAPLADRLQIPVLLKVRDDISTDEILPAGAKVLPLRSNIEAISHFAFAPIASNYHARALELRGSGGHAIVGGSNYGQGSSREHAALAPRHLGLKVVLAKSFARIHWQNLVNFAVLPLVFEQASDYEQLSEGDLLVIDNIREQLQQGDSLEVTIQGKDQSIEVMHTLSPRQRDMLLAGGLVSWLRQRRSGSC